MPVAKVKRKRCSKKLQLLLDEVRACRICEADLALGPRPVLAAHQSARVAIIGQAPGSKVHATGIPWNDPSGKRLRQWMQVSDEIFYNPEYFAIIPMGFCFPGTGKGGDLPPRPECAPTWHPNLFKLLPKIELKILLGQYALARYLGRKPEKRLTDTVAAWRDLPSDILPMPHPSPRNQRWFRNHPWFETEVVPDLRQRLSKLDIPQL